MKRTRTSICHGPWMALLILCSPLLQAQEPIFHWQPFAVDGKPSHRLLPRGLARAGKGSVIHLDQGAVEVQGVDKALFDACRKSGQLTIETVISTASLQQSGPARIVTFSLDAGNRNFTLGQDGDKLILRVRTPQTGLNGSKPQLTLTTLPLNRAVHVAVTYQSGQATCYVEGKQVMTTNKVRGDFSNWEPYKLLFGDEAAGDRDWQGMLDGVSLYARVLTEAEVRRHAATYRKARGPLKTVVAVKPPAHKHWLPVLASSAKIRIFVESDLPGGDPDDEGSMTRFFHYLNEFDLEGIVGTRKASQSRTGKDGKATILLFIDAYEKVYGNLRLHDPDYPAPRYLRSIARQCYAGTEGRDLLIKAVDKKDPRPVVISNWGTNDGNPSSARQALDYVKRTRSNAEYRAFAGKIIMCEGGGQETAYQLRGHYPAFHRVIDTFSPSRWYWRWRPLTEKAGGFDINRDVKRGHGPLGERYTIQKEGDTPCFMHCLPTGLVQIDQPFYGSWAGRFGYEKRQLKYMANQKDAWGGSSSRDNTLKRWAVHIQNDFAARADWCVKSYSRANHPPVPVVNGNKTLDVIYVKSPPHKMMALSASGSADPDGDKMQYEWIYYPEPGTYSGRFSLSSLTGERTSFKTPSDFTEGHSIHVVLAVTDNGKPALTRYRRIVVQGQ